jgi:uncharacterized membrane protein HdeD (DUF308 family)
MPSDCEFTSLHLVGTGDLGKRWRSVLWFGVLLIVLGVIATSAAPFLTLTSMVLIGSLLIFVGLLQGLHAFAYRRWGGVFVDVLASLLYLVVGFLFIANPGATAEALTLLIALFLIFGGVFRIVIASMVRFHNAVWLLLHGAINTLLGIMIWQQWPMSGHIVIGLFIGIDLIFNGLSLVMLGLAAKKLKPE